MPGWKTVELNSVKDRGALYHFTGSWQKLANIVDSKELRTSMPEPHMEFSKKYSDARARFVSLARTPSVIYNASPDWKFGVIIDSGQLPRNTDVRPYAYNYSNHIANIRVSVGDDGRHPYQIDTDDAFTPNHMSGVRYINDSQLDEFIDWFYSIEDDSKYDAEEVMGGYEVEFSLGTLLHPNRKPKEGNTPVDSKTLPNVVQWMLKASGYESEERLYPEHKDPGWRTPEDPNDPESKMVPESIDITKALRGVLVPDTEYYTKKGERFRHLFPDVPMYVYRDPWNPWRKEYKRPPIEAYKFYK